MLCYIYIGDYFDEPAETLHAEGLLFFLYDIETYLHSTGDDIELFKHPQVFALADVFRIEELKGIACKKFEQLQTYWFSDTFPDSIREVYSISNNIDSNSIRDTVVNAVALYKQDLVRKGPF